MARFIWYINKTTVTRIIDIDINAGTMTVEGNELLQHSARGIIGNYNSDGVLEKVYMSDNTADIDNNILRFSGLNVDKDKTVRGFLWRDDNGLTCIPEAAAYTYGQSVYGTWDSADIIVGTLGASMAVDALAASDKLDVSEIESKWESFTIQDVDGKIVIAGSDKRGTIF